MLAVTGHNWRRWAARPVPLPLVAIDGSKFKAVNNRDKNFTVAKVAKRIEQVEASVVRYLAALDHADRQDGDVAEAKTARLKEKIEGLRRQMQSLKEMGKQVEASPDKQVSLTDPDERAGNPSGLRAVRRAVPSVQPVHPGCCCHRREQVQSGQQP